MQLRTAAHNMAGRFSRKRDTVSAINDSGHSNIFGSSSYSRWVIATVSSRGYLLKIPERPK